MRKSTKIILTVTMVLLLAGPVLAGGAKEGIAVHGHWKIEIFEPDGTPVSITEFENALVITGKGTLALLLDNDASVGGWTVSLDNGSTGTEPCGSAAAPAACLLGETGVNWGSEVLHSTNLVATQSGGDIELSGTVTAENTTTIGVVASYTKRCLGTVTPVNCPASASDWSLWGFTATNLASPPSVQAGQIIQVTVTISFS
jgi:hypothetical protein